MWTAHEGTCRRPGQDKKDPVLGRAYMRSENRVPAPPPAGQWWPCAVSEAPLKRRATARNGRVTTVAMAPPMERRTSATALNTGFLLFGVSTSAVPRSGSSGSYPHAIRGNPAFARSCPAPGTDESPRPTARRIHRFTDGEMRLPPAPPFTDAQVPELRHSGSFPAERMRPRERPGDVRGHRRAGVAGVGGRTAGCGGR